MDDLVPAGVPVGSSPWVGVTWPPAVPVDDAAFGPEWVAQRVGCFGSGNLDSVAAV